AGDRLPANSDLSPARAWRTTCSSAPDLLRALLEVLPRLRQTGARLGAPYALALDQAAAGDPGADAADPADSVADVLLCDDRVLVRADHVLKRLRRGDDAVALLPEQVRRQLGRITQSLRLDARTVQRVIRCSRAERSHLALQLPELAPCQPVERDVACGDRRSVDDLAEQRDHLPLPLPLDPSH